MPLFAGKAKRGRVNFRHSTRFVPQRRITVDHAKSSNAKKNKNQKEKSSFPRNVFAGYGPEQIGEGKERAHEKGTRGAGYWASKSSSKNRQMTRFLGRTIRLLAFIWRKSPRRFTTIHRHQGLQSRSLTPATWPRLPFIRPPTKFPESRTENSSDRALEWDGLLKAKRRRTDVWQFCMKKGVSTTMTDVARRLRRNGKKVNWYNDEGRVGGARVCGGWRSGRF